MVYLNYQYNYLFSQNRYKPFYQLKNELEARLNDRSIFGTWKDGVHDGTGRYYDLDDEFT